MDDSPCEPGGANNWEDYHFQCESELHGGSRPTVCAWPPFSDTFYQRNEGVQGDESTPPNKRSRTHYHGDPQILTMEQHEISSMAFNERPSIVRVSDHNNTNYTNNRHPSNHCSDVVVNNAIGSRPWSLGLGDETVCMPSDRTEESGAPPTATSNLIDVRPFLQSIAYLDPDPLAPPELRFRQGSGGRSRLLGNVGAVVDTTSAMNHGAPPEGASFTNMGNDMAALEKDSDETFLEMIDFMCLSDPGAREPTDHSCEHPNGNGAQPGNALDPSITLPFPCHPVLNRNDRQTVAYTFSRVDHQTQVNPTEGPPAKMVAGVQHGVTPHRRVYIHQVDCTDLQQTVLVNFQPVVPFQSSPHAMMVVDQGTPSTGTNLTMLTKPTSQPESSKVGQHQQQNVAVSADDKDCPPGIPLSLPCDEKKLSGYQTLLRQQLEFFVADSEDVQSGGQGRKKKLSLGQVGLRCIHCRHLPWTRRGHAAIYFPSTLEGVYQAAQNMAANHLCGSCYSIPVTLQEELKGLRKGNAHSSARYGKFYWAEACRTIGLVESTKNGLRLKRRGSNKKQAPKKDVVVAKSPPKRG